MPIRHCQKCGLKVLVDESQTTTSQFYCQRCTSSIQSTGEPTEAKAGPAIAAKPPIMKVTCPYCKAVFNGRMPAKPAKGACPVCQKQLILLPTGEVCAAAGFDVAKWMQEQSSVAPAAPPAFSAPPTKLEMKRAPAPLPEETQVPDEPAPAPEPAANPQDPSWLSEAPTPVPAGGASAAEAPAAAVEPPAEPVAEEPAAVPKGVTSVLKKQLTSRRDRADKPAVAFAPSTGGGKIFFAFILMILPVIAVPVLMGTREKLKGTLDKVGTRFSAGFYKLYEQLNPPPAPPPPPPKEEKKEPPAPPKEEKPDPAKQKEHDQAQIIKTWEDYMRTKRTVDTKAVGATESQKVEIEEARVGLKKKEERLNDLIKLYKEAFNEEYDPRKQ